MKPLYFTIYLLLFSINLNGQEYKNPYFYGFYYKASSISLFNTNKTLFSYGSSFGYSYHNIKPDEKVGFDFSLEFLNQNINSRKDISSLTTFSNVKYHFSSIEAGFKISFRIPVNRFGIYINPGICFGTFQFLKRKEFQYTSLNSQALTESEWISYGESSDGLTLGGITNFGFDFHLTQKCRLYLDYCFVTKTEISKSSNFSYFSNGLRFGFCLKSSENKKKTPYK